MKIGIPKEIKNNENRVAITPSGVVSFVKNGHEVLIEKDAGIGSGFSNDEYKDAGAKIIDSAEKVWSEANILMKVKEPLSSEYKYFREDLTLYTYLHLANEPELTKAIVDSKMLAIAYETVQVGRTLPLLTPMSEVAGRMSVQIGAQFLQKYNGGQGILLGGVPATPKGNVVVIGGGVVGTNAAKMAVGLGANVTMIDISLDRLREIDDMFGMRVSTLASNPGNVEAAVKNADLVIGAVLIPGQKAPALVSEEMVKQMKPGSVIVDVAIDQGGCIATADRVTTHDNPTYELHGVVHYSVANMPGAVPRTSTIALTNATLHYGLLMANNGVVETIKNNEALKKGVNVMGGKVTYKAVAEDLKYDFVEVDTLI